MTGKELVIQEAVNAGFPVPDDEEIEWVLWEHTGFPCFLMGDTPESKEATLLGQIREFYQASAKRKATSNKEKSSV